MPLIEGIKDTLKQLKYRGPQANYCPKCRSSNMHQTATFGILPAKYRCSNCGYEGSFVLELDDELSDSPESDEPEDAS